MTRSHQFVASSCVLMFALAIAFAAQVTRGQDLRANPPADAVGPMATPRPKPDERLHVQLKDGSLLVGKLADDQVLQLDCVLGKVDVPATKLTSVYFLEDGKARCAFRNGDALTGDLQNKQLKLQASWGEIAIDMENVNAIVSHDEAAKPGTIVYRTFQKTPEGDKVEWQVHTNQPSYPTPSASYPTPTAPYGYTAPAPGAYAPGSTASPATRPSRLVPAPTGAR